MTVVVVTLSIVVAILAVLVVGLLRSHAEILRRLHELGAGSDPTAPPAVVEPTAGTPAPPPAAATGPGTGDGTRAGAHPTGRPTVVSGTTLTGDPLAVRTDHRDRDTVLLFLSSGCSTCAVFWDALADRSAMNLPPQARLVVVTQDLGEESPAALARVAPQDITLVASSAAWHDFGVHGSPYVVHVEAGTGRVLGEGTGTSWPQVTRLLAEATGDLAYLGGDARRRRRAAGDRTREQRADRALLAAGILPGDDRLYRRAANEDEAPR